MPNGPFLWGNGVSTSIQPGLQVPGSTSGNITILPAAVTTIHTLTLPASNATGTLTNNGSGVLSWAPAPGTGTVTSVSIVNANGLSGTVATATTTPAITLSIGTQSPYSVPIGAGDGATPIAFTLRGPAAVGSDIAGANWTFDASNGTGVGGSGAMIFRTAPVPTAVAPTYVSTTQNMPSNVFNTTFSHVVAAGSNRLLVVEVSLTGTTTVSSITYGGVSLTLLGAKSDAGGNVVRGEIWYLIAPAVGTANIVATFSLAAFGVVQAINLTGAAQTSPFETLASANGSGTTASLTPTSTTNELVLDLAVFFSSTTNSNTAGQTSIWNTLAVTAAGSGSYKASTASTTTMSWTNAQNGVYAVLAVAVKGAQTPTASNTLAEVFRINSQGFVGLTPTTAKTANYTLTATDSFVSGSGAGGAFTLTLPTAVGIAGQIYRLNRTDMTLANLITIATTSSQTIGIYGTSVNMATQGETWAVISDGANWQVLYHHTRTGQQVYTVPITATTTNPTKSSSPTYDKAVWWRDGSFINIIYEYKQTVNTGAAAGSGTYLFGVPTGVTADGTNLTFDTTNSNPVVGSGQFGSTSPTGMNYGTASLYSSSQVIMNAAGNQASSALAQLSNNTVIYGFAVKFPVTNWKD